MDYCSWKETWSDELFLKGYLAGIKGREEIENALRRSIDEIIIILFVFLEKIQKFRVFMEKPRKIIKN